MGEKKTSKAGKSKTDTFIKLVLIFFISLLSFSVGTFVGKKFSDNQNKISALEEEYTPSRDTASVDPAAMDVKPSEALTDEDIAKLAEEFISDEDETIDKELKDKEVAQTNKEIPEKTQQPSSEAKKVVQGKTPLAQSVNKTKNQITNKSRVPSSLPSAVAAHTIGKYTVQIASYSSEKEAKHQASELKNKGFSAFYMPAKIKGKTWFRVSVGLFQNHKQAVFYRKKLIKQAKVNSAIVQKILR